VLANLRNGEDFEGISFPRLPGDLVLVTQSSASNKLPVIGRMGDFPAIHFTAKELGWNMATAQSEPKVITYEDRIKFDGFIQSHGFSSFIEEHTDLRDPTRVVQETYTRFAKALVYVVPDATSTKNDRNNAANTASNSIKENTETDNTVATLSLSNCCTTASRYLIASWRCTKNRIPM